ncbi:MAG TPA: GyrI-like domain-containing protein [Actinomycetota bacterium]
MSYEVQVKEVPGLLVASVMRRASMATVGKEVPEAFRELAEAVTPIGFGDGMPGVEYLGEVGPETEWDMRIFMPVAGTFDPPEGMTVETLPGGTYASTVHRGSYAGLGAAYEAITAWIDANGRRVVGPPRELYLNDPNEVGEDETLTEILFPIR